MSVNNGENASAENFNSSFMSREQDTSTLGKVALDNVDSTSVTDAQKFLEEISDTQGTTEGDVNRKNYANENYIVDGDSQKTAIEKLDAQAKVNADNTAANTIDIGDIQADYGQPNGLATLDGSGKVPADQMQVSVMNYQGDWDADTNSPDLTIATPTLGDAYRVSVDGATDLDGITDWKVGDWAYYDGTVWRKADNTDAVTSVASKTGDVTLDADDVSETTAKFWDIKNNRTAIIPPAAGNDNTEGYVVGSTWFDTVGGISYIAQDVSTGAAVWLEFGSGSGGGGAINFDPLGDMEKAEAADFTAVGLTHSMTDVVGEFARGEQALKAVASAASQTIERTVDVPAGYRNDGSSKLSVRVRNNADWKVELFSGSTLMTSNEAFNTEDDWTEIVITGGLLPTETQMTWKFTSSAADALYVDDVIVNTDKHVSTELVESQYIKYDGHAGYGSTNTYIPYYTNFREDKGADILKIENSSTNGFSLTALMPCTVELNQSVQVSGANFLNHGFSLNSTQLTTNIFSINDIDKLGMATTTNQNAVGSAVSVSVELKAGDIVRPHFDAKVAVASFITVMAKRTKAAVIAPADTQTGWTKYTPIFTGFGTVSVEECFWRRNGDSVDIKGRFSAGTSTATEARLSFPNSLVSANSSKMHSSLEIVGSYGRSATSVASKGGFTLAEPSVGYITFSHYDTVGGSSAAPIAKANATNVIPSSNEGSFFATVPIEGWSSSEYTVVPVGNKENEYSARVSNNGTSTIESQSAPFIQSATTAGTGDVDIVFVPGFFSEAPSVLAIPEDVAGNRSVTYTGLTSSGVTIRTASLANSPTNDNFHIRVQRQGSDYVAPEAVYLGNINYPQTCYVRDVRAYNVDGGTSTSTTVHTRAFNTIENGAGFASLNTNQVTLKVGEYEIEGFAQCYRGARNWIFLHDGSSQVGEASPVAYADVANFGYGVPALKMSLKITAETTYELRHYIESGLATNGLGISTNVVGYNSIYAELKITKVK